MVWLPFVLILGMREEAGLVIAPLFFYFALKEKWRVGYWYGMAAIIYVALAFFLIYPAINGMSLIARRHVEFSQKAELVYLARETFRVRFISLAWIFLPLLPLLIRAWCSILFFMIVPVLLTLGSTEPTQVALRHHYPAVITAFLGIVMFHEVRGRNEHRLYRRFFPAWLMLATVWSFYDKGFLEGSRPADWKETYQQINPAKQKTWPMVRDYVPHNIPVYAPKELRSLLGNRAMVHFHEPHQLDDYPARACVIEPNDRMNPDFASAILDGSWRVGYVDDRYTVLLKK